MNQTDNIFIEWAGTFLNLKLSAEKMVSNKLNSVYKLVSLDNNYLVYYLKIGPESKSEFSKLKWLENKVLSPKALAIYEFESRIAILETSINGFSLAKLTEKWKPEVVIEKLAAVIFNLHNLDFQNCPFGDIKLGNVITHGDACLPNFIFTEDQEFTGYIDLGDLKLAKPEVDLSAAIWSLQFNYGTDNNYGVEFLKAYGVKNPTKLMVSQLWEIYESSLA